MPIEGEHHSEKRMLTQKVLAGSAHAADYGSLGLLHARSFTHGAAIANLEKAINLGSTETSVWTTLASEYLRAGLFRRAENLMRQLISVGAYSAWTLMEYGRLLIKMGHHANAVEFFTPLSTHSDLRFSTASRAVLVECYSCLGQLERAATLADHSSIWPHMFAASACNRIRLIAQSANISLTRNHTDSDPHSVGVSIDSLGYHGRLGHTLVEYLHIRHLADRLGVAVETPEWLGQLLFELNDPPIRHPRSFVQKTPLELQNAVDSLGAEALCGYDLFSPGPPVTWTEAVSAKAREIFKFRPFLLPHLERFVKKVRQKGETLIAFHIRLGDREAHTMENQNPNFYLNWLADNWHKFGNPILYIGSDNISKAVDWFSDYNPFSCASFASELHDLEWLFDFYLFTKADIIGVSHSSFSLLPCVLNTNRSVIILKPDPHFGTLRPFSVESNSNGWC